MKNVIKYKQINNDLFAISSRLKKLDKNYFIVFNKLKNRYEVHNKNQKGTTLAFCLTSSLNAYALKKANETSIKNAKKILSKINIENKKLIEKQENENLSKHLEQFNSYLNYANNKSCDCEF